MGELIEFPRRPGPVEGPGGSGSERTPVEGPRAGKGVGRRAAPSAASDDAPETVRWAVPVIDSGETAVAEPEPERDDRRARRASNVAMAALARHDASEGEVRARLVAKGLEQDEIEGELARLRSAGLIDDAAFAARLVASLRERKGLGDGAIRSTLRTRLVPPSVVDAVLAEHVEDEETLHERLEAVAHDRARRLTTLPSDVAERRLTAYLLRKGYGGSEVRAAVRTALADAGRR